MKNLQVLLTGVVGIFVGAAIFWFLDNVDPVNSEADQGEKKPLYWVAPMDPNYRRDGPGKSPMGMDLIPIYADSAARKNEPGLISIAPEVVNNLGVRTVKAEYKRLDTSINTVGYVQYNEDRLVHIHPRVAGWVDKLYVKSAGEPVEKGQALYSLYSPELVNAQEEYLLATRNADSRFGSSAIERLHALNVPVEAIDSLNKTRKVQQTVTFSSPQKGVVDNLNIREGFYVQPGTTMMSIAALDEVWVTADVYERQIAGVKQGLRAQMDLNYYPEKTWEGVVDYVYPTLESMTRTAQVRLRFKNTDGLLKPNMFAHVHIKSPEVKALVIPEEALIRTANQNRVVLALGEGKFKSIAVETGRFFDNEVEIISGLREGEAVVSSAQFLLDSESSKTSDFKRMETRDPLPEPDQQPVWVSATVDEILHEGSMLRLTHEAIEAWNMPGMTMNFPIDAAVDLSGLRVNTEIHVQIDRDAEGNFSIVAIHIPDEEGMQHD